MKVTYIKLKNVAGIYVGSKRDEIEINFDKSINKIVAIVGKNGNGKSVLISSITPFAFQTAVDDRSTLSYILQHKDGYKEIHYQDGDDNYIIKHYYKASKESHTVKSYFMKNGEELNENGNVTSFNDLVSVHFGLTQEMMRLIRIGTNVNSFITLTPAKRKEYIGKLIEEIDLYLKIYKKITDDIRVIKTMMQANNTNLYNCHIQDQLTENEKLNEINKNILKYEKERDELISKLAKINTLIKDNNIDELKHKQHDAESSIKELENLHSKIKENNLDNIDMDDLIKIRNKYTDSKLDIKSKINSYRITIDSILSNIERLQLSVKKITSNNDIQSLVLNIKSLKDELDNTSDIVKNYKPNGITYAECNEVLHKLQSFNQTSKMIYTLGDKPIKLYIKVRKDNNVDDWLKFQKDKLSSQLKSSDFENIIERIFKDDSLISPICSSELFNECPYYRLHDMLFNEKKKLDEESVDAETLNYISIISNNIDQILNELDLISNMKIPQSIRSKFNEKILIHNLEKHLPFIDLSDFEQFLSLLNDWEIYSKNKDRLLQLENQLSVYKKAGIDSQVEEINKQEEQISYYKNQLITLQEDLTKIDSKLTKIDENISIISKYNDAKKYEDMIKSTLETTKKILEPLENASNEKIELEFSLKQISNAINLSRENHRELETKLIEYNRLVDEGKKLAKKNKDLSIIQEAVSTKKGIPVYYMKRYLTKIQRLANELLSIIYGDDFSLSAFNVTPETFEVPYIKNGRKIPDIKYSSQSEIALSTMALSFALASNASTKYNILLIDELDAGLDSTNRASFLKMLYMQMEKLNAEQIFIISHNLSQMTNVPMDCINLSENESISKLQNIIYE